MELWLNSRRTRSADALFKVAFHQLSNTTLSNGHSNPSEWILRLLSGLNMDTFLPVPQSISNVSVTANALP